MRRLNNYIETHKELIFILPILLFNLIFIIGGIFKGFIDSFGNEFYVNGWFLDNQFILFNKEILKSLLFTFKVATLSALISLVLAICIIYIMHITPKLKPILKQIFYIPVLTPYLLIGFFMLYTFSTSGFFNRILLNIGLIDSMKNAPIYINDPQGLGIILTYIWKATPFLTLFIISAYENFNKNFINLSISLGATQRRTFFSIILPYLKKSIIYSTLIIFIFIFSSVEIPLILGPTRPQTLSHWAYENFKTGNINYRSRSLAINSSILFFNIITITLIAKNFFKENNHEKDY